MATARCDMTFPPPSSVSVPNVQTTSGKLGPNKFDDETFVLSPDHAERVARFCEELRLQNWLRSYWPRPSHHCLAKSQKKARSLNGLPSRAPVKMPEITLGEVEAQLFKMKPWSAPGDDGLPVIVWRKIWPAMKHRALKLFRTSLEKGVLPDQ